MRKAVAFAVLGVLLGGCDELAALREPPKQVSVTALTPADAEVAEKVLQARFDQYRRHIFSSTSSKRDGRRVTFVFERGSPSDAVLGYLVATRGRFVISSLEAQVWATGKDVVGAQVGPGSDDEYALFIEFTDAAAKRLEALSLQQQGQIVIVNFDGKVLATPSVTGKLGNRVTIPVKKKQRELLLIATVLRSGELPADVTVTGNMP